MDRLSVGDRVRIDAKWHGDSWNNHLGTVVLNSSESMQGLVAVSLDVLDETSDCGPIRYFDHVVRIHNVPVDGGTYVLDADGLDALGVGARIEESAGTVTAIRKESGWGSNWWAGILNSEEVTRYYRHLSFRVLDEGAPLEKPDSVTVTVGSYAPDTVLVVQKDGSLKVVHAP